VLDKIDFCLWFQYNWDDKQRDSVLTFFYKEKSNIYALVVILFCNIQKLEIYFKLLVIIFKN